MTRPPEHALAPLIRKLDRRVKLGAVEIEALERLPHHIAEVDRGRFIVREGDKPGHCMAIVEGFIYRNKITGDGGRQILSVHLHGDLVCAHDQLLGEADHNIQALTRARLAYIPQDALLAAFEEHPVLARAVWRDNLIDGSVAREWLLNVGRRNARQRVAHMICGMAVRSEAAGLGSGSKYVWPLTQEQIGDASGLTSVHTNRIIQSLRRDELVKLGRGEVRIVDWLGLQLAGDFRSSYLHEQDQARLAA